MSNTVEFLYDEGPCFVLNKPGGLLTQAVEGVDSMEARLKAVLREREGKNGDIYVGVPHRLDRPVSGAIIMARHVRAARRLAEQFEGRMVRKTYWAVVEGIVPEERGLWRDFLHKVKDQPQAAVVDRQHPEAKLAQLRFQVLKRFDNRTWLEIELDTGRYHQIRLQASARGWPVVGDFQYGATLPFGPITDDPRERLIALHARQIAFRHPMTRLPVDITAPAPAPWPESFGSEPSDAQLGT